MINGSIGIKINGKYIPKIGRKYEFIKLIEKAYSVKKRVKIIFLEKKYNQKRVIAFNTDELGMLKNVIVNEYNSNLKCDYIEILDFEII